MRPAMDRKIFSAFAPAKHSQKANMNESFKKGLRNALTGLYVPPPLPRNNADEKEGHLIVLEYPTNVDPRIPYLLKMRS